MPLKRVHAVSIRSSFGWAFVIFLPLCCSVLCCSTLRAQQTEVASPAPTKAVVVEQAVQAANAFLETLEKKQHDQAVYSFTDDQQRERWSNLPVGKVPRGSLRWGDLSEAQKEAAMAILKATLSENGVQQVVDNMNGDEYLKLNSKGETSFGNDEYFLAILGKPSTTNPWMLQFGGHHLAINVTVVGEEMTLSPSLTGGQPIDYEWEGKQVRQVAAEEDAAYALIASLSEEQLKKAVIADRYKNLRFGPKAKKNEPTKEGICADQFNAEQTELFKTLIKSRISVLNETHAAGEMEAITASLSEAWFSWQGPTKAGGDASYRIQSPKILMEYCPQRLGGIPTNHIHAMYRDPSNDYGLGFIEAERARLNKAQGISGSAVSPSPNQ